MTIMPPTPSYRREHREHSIATLESDGNSGSDQGWPTWGKERAGVGGNLTFGDDEMDKAFALDQCIALKQQVAVMREEIESLRQQLAISKKTRDAAVLALETEHGAATRYAQQVAHWIEKRDDIKQQLAECERNMQDLNIRLGLEIGRKNEQLATVTAERDELSERIGWCNAELNDKDKQLEAVTKERDDWKEAYNQYARANTILRLCNDHLASGLVRVKTRPAEESAFIAAVFLEDAKTTYGFDIAALAKVGADKTGEKT